MKFLNISTILYIYMHSIRVPNFLLYLFKQDLLTLNLHILYQSSQTLNTTELVRKSGSFILFTILNLVAKCWKEQSAQQYTVV